MNTFILDFLLTVFAYLLLGIYAITILFYGFHGLKYGYTSELNRIQQVLTVTTLNPTMIWEIIFMSLYHGIMGMLVGILIPFVIFFD